MTHPKRTGGHSCQIIPGVVKNFPRTKESKEAQELILIEPFSLPYSLSVIGSLRNFDCPGCEDWMPLKTWDSFAIVPLPGSGNPSAMCSWHVADRYTFMVLWEIPLSASTDTKRNRVSSEAGTGTVADCSQNDRYCLWPIW